MVPQTLYDLLHSSTVLITVPKRSQGTGFFVAPGLVLTCAHVVEYAQQNNVPVEASWNGQTVPAKIQKSLNAVYPDLALLEVNLTNHPCVFLYGGANPYDHLYSYGFPDIEPKGASTTFECEGWVGDKQELLRFKQGQARPGMSGSPLLNWETGSICGIVQSTRDRNTDLGGKALLAKVIFREFPELADLQKQYHQQNRQWIDTLDIVQRQRLNVSWINELSTPPTGAIEVFTSYVEEDDVFRRQLIKHLVQMKRDGLITGHDRNLGAGTAKDEEAKKYLDRARIILLLVSPDFLSSEYIYDVEMKRALERHNARAARVIPIILRSTTDWDKTKFAQLVSLPRDGRPVNKWSDRDEAFAEVAREIRQVVEYLKKANPQ